MNIREAIKLMLDGEIVTHESFGGFEAIGVVFRHNNFIRIDKDLGYYDIFYFKDVINEDWHVYKPKTEKWLWIYISNKDRTYQVTVEKYANAAELYVLKNVHKVVRKIDETGEYI